MLFYKLEAITGYSSVELQIWKVLHARNNIFILVEEFKPVKDQ